MTHGVFFRRVACLLVCTSLAYTTIALAQTAPPAGVVTALTGEATLSHATAPGQPVPLKFRDDLFYRDLLRTQARSIARVLLGGKAVVTVRALSELTILEEPQQGAVVDLADGKIALYVARSKMKPGEVIKIRTPHAIAAVRGTLLIGEVDSKTGTTKFFVGDGGSVDITHTASGATTTLADGKGLDVTGASIGQPYSSPPAGQLLADLIVPTPQHAGTAAETLQATNQSQLATATTLAQFIAPQSGQVTPNGPSAPYTPCQTSCGSSTITTTTTTGPLVIPPSHTSVANETFSTVTHSASAGNDTLDGSFTLTATGLYTWSGGTQQGTGTTLAQGGMLMTGTGSPTLSRTLQLGDGTTASASTFGLTGGGALLFNNGTLVVLNAHTLNLTTGMGFTAVGGTNAVTINSGGTLAVASGATNTIQPLLTNDGTVNITSGTLQLAGGGSGTGTVVLANAAGATLDLSNNNATTGSLAGGGATGGNVTLGSGTLTTGDASNTTFAGVVSGTGGLTKQGTGTFTLSGVNIYTGLTTINAGTLQLGAANVLSTSTTLSVNGGVFDLGANSNTVAGVTLQSGNITGTTGVLTSTTDYAVQSGNVSAILGGTVGLTKSTGGTVTLSGANTYTGLTTINGGTLSASGGSALVDTGAVNVAAAGATFNLVSSETIGSQTGVAGSAVTLNANTLTTGDATNTTFAGVMSGTGGLTKQGAGTFTLSGANTYTGLTTINGGTLSVSGGSALVDTGAVNVAAAGATFNLVSSETIGSLTGVAGSAVTLNANTLTTGDASNTTFAGVMSGTGGLTKQGTGTFTLSGTDTYTGLTTVNAGTLLLTGGNPSTGSFTVASGSQLEFGGGTYNLNAGTLLSGAGSVDITAGTVNLNAGTIYRLTGTTTVSGGTLAASGDLVGLGASEVFTPTGAVLMVSGGTLTTGGSVLNIPATATLTLSTSALAVSITGSVTSNAPLVSVGGTLDPIASALIQASDTASITTIGAGSHLVSVPAGGSLTLSGQLLQMLGTAPTVTVGGDVLNVAGTVTGPLGGLPLLDVAAGTLSTTGALANLAGSGTDLSGPLLTQSGGSISAGTGLTLASGASLGPAGPGALFQVSGGALATSADLVDMSAGGSTLNLAGPLLSATGGASVNVGSDLFNVSGPSTVNVGGSLVLVQNGAQLALGGSLLTMPSGAPTVTVGGDVLQVDSASTFTGPVGPALINVAASGATLNVTGALANLAGSGTTLSGPLLTQSGGTITAGTGLNVAPGGVLGPWTLSGPLFQVTGGMLSTTGNVVSVPGGAALTLDNTLLSASGTGSVQAGAAVVSVGGTLNGTGAAPLVELSGAGASITSPSGLLQVGAGGTVSLIGPGLSATGGTIDTHNPNYNTAIGSPVGVGSAPQFVAVSDVTLRAYVTNSASNTVSVIDTTANMVVGTIPVGSNPVGVATGTPFSPSNSRAYVANLNDNTVSVIDTTSNALFTTITSGIGTSPERVAVSPNGNNAYVTNFGSTFISVISTASNTATTVDISSMNALGVAVTPDNGRAYVVIGGASPSVKVIDTGTNSVIATIAGLGTSPAEIAMAPNGTRAYVTNFGSNSLSVIDTNPAHTTALGWSSNSYNTVIATITGLSGSPQGIALNSISNQLYVTEGNGNIEVVNLSINRVIATFGGGSNPMGIAFTPDASRAVVASTGGSIVTVFDSNSGGSVLAMTGGATLTSSALGPLLQFTGTGVTTGSFVRVVGAGSSLGLAGGLLDATDTTFTTANSSIFLLLLDGASLTTSGTSAPLLNLTGTAPGLSSVTTDRSFVALAQTLAGSTPPTMTLSGPLLNASQTTFTTGDPTSNTFPFLFVGDSATLTSTGTAPLMSFDKSTVDTAGNILTLRRSTSTSLPSTLTLAGPLFSATNGSSFNTTSLGNVTSACCPGFNIAQGALLTSSTTQPLIQLTNSTFNAGPDSQSGGNFFNVSDTGGLAGELVAPASVSLAGPLLSATGGNISALFSLFSVGRSNFTSTSPDPLIQLNGTTVSLGGLDPIAGVPTRGRVLSLFTSATTPASLVLQGPLFAATNATLSSTDNMFGFFDSSTFTSTTASPLISFMGGSATAGAGALTGLSYNFIAVGSGLGLSPTVSLAGPLLSASNTTLKNGDPTKNAFSFLFIGDSSKFTSTTTAPLLSFDNASLDSSGGVLSLRRSLSTTDPTRLTLSGPLFSATNGSIFNTTSLGNGSACCDGFGVRQAAELISTTTAPLIQLSGSTFNAGPDAQSGGNFFGMSDDSINGPVTAPAKVSLAGPLLSATGGNISALFSLFSVGRSSFTSTSPDPLIQLNGTTVSLGGFDPIAGVPTRGRVLSLFTSATTPASLVLQGPLFAATNATVSSTDTMFGFFDSSTFTSTTASPLISFSGGSATAGAGALAGLSGGFIVVASGLHLPPTMTLTGPLLSATSANLSNGDPTKNVLSFIFIGDSAQVTSTTAAPLLAFDGSSVNTSGDVLALGRSLSVAAPTKLTLSGPLFSATNSSGFITTSLGNVTLACCDTFFISQGAQLSSTTALPLIQLTNSTLSAGPDLQSGGNVIGVFDTYTTAPPSELVAPATVTLSGPLLTATGSTISALFSLLNVTRSSLVSTSTEPLVQFLNTGINLGGTNPITGSPTSGFLLVENSATGGSNAPTTVSLRGPFLQAVNSTLTTSAVGIGVFNGASLASSTAFPFVTLDNTSLTTGAGAGGDFLNVSGLGGSTGTATSSASFNGPLLLVSNGSNVILQRDVIIGSKDPTITGTGSAPFIQVIGGSLTTGPSGTVAGLGNGTKLILAGPLLSVASTLTAPDGLANVSNGGQLTVTGSTDPLVSFSGGSSTVAGNSGSSMFNLRGTATAVDVESGLILGTDRPIQGPLQSDATRPVLTSLLETSGASVAGQQVMNIDTALLEATAPLLNLKAGSVMTSSQDVINLLQKANLNSTAASMVTLNASTLNVDNGALFNVAGGSKLKTMGDLILLSGGALLDIRNGTILNISGNSFTSIGGGLLNLGAGGGTLRVTNGLCAAGCTNYSGVQVFLTGGALAGNISITNPLKNGASITYGSPTAAAIVISGSGSKLTITGN